MRSIRGRIVIDRMEGSMATVKRSMTRRAGYCSPQRRCEKIYARDFSRKTKPYAVWPAAPLEIQCFLMNEPTNHHYRYR